MRAVEVSATKVQERKRLFLIGVKGEETNFRQAVAYQVRS